MNDCGSATAEAMLALTAIMLVILLGVAGGRITVATAAVEAAARDAARQGSIGRSAAEAERRATSSAQDSLSGRGIRCTSVSVQVNTAGFSRRVGSPATITATVSCSVPLNDVAFAGLPGSILRRAAFTSPLDPYRGRDG